MVVRDTGIRPGIFYGDDGGGCMSDLGPSVITVVGCLSVTLELQRSSQTFAKSLILLHSHSIC
jgi:hypothetical protein